MSTIYKITIERVTTERRVVKQWVKLYEERQGDEDQYGYRGVEQDVKEGVTIYTQQVEDLDLVAVIQAVNKVDGNKITLVRQPMVFGAPGENVEIKS